MNAEGETVILAIIEVLLITERELILMVPLPWLKIKLTYSPAPGLKLVFAPVMVTLSV